MFGRWKARPRAAGAVEIRQPPGAAFPWRAGMTITAVDEVTIALPQALLKPDERMGDVIQGDDGAQIALGPGETLLFCLAPKMSLTIKRSCQACIVADDPRPRRILLRGDAGGGPAPG